VSGREVKGLKNKNTRKIVLKTLQIWKAEIKCSESILYLIYDQSAQRKDEQ
jgi:hypothetical protein